MSETSRNRSLVLHIGHEELVIRRRYEVASIANDILIALWFIAGSVMFFSEAWTVAGTWCFLAGSIELLARPVIRLGRHLHLRKVQAKAPPSGPAGVGRAATAGEYTESPQDY
ncbi:YrhK family protein [Streptomyces sp. NPDC059740]|uniref:YrhK family protein n=1 Tax=Streptomyces sp. NPDC059740 TaxID=3346926 RepID=UPI0036650A39